MKFSEAIRRGIVRFPKQTIGANQRGNDRACVDGCARWGYTGNADAPLYCLPSEYSEGIKAFANAYNAYPEYLNDVKELSREEIAQMFENIGH